VFTRFGLANTVATTWLPAAHMLLKAAGFEATLTETAHLLEFSVRAGAAIFSGAAGAARRYPLPAAGLMVGAPGTHISTHAMPRRTCRPH
jgi:hypothetical protein